MTNPERIDGGCLCGKVRFSVQLPSKWCAHCHCGMCRRAHGAGFVTWVGFPCEQFSLSGDPEHLSWFKSSEGARRGFCNRCGSSMLFESDRWPGETHVALACLDSPIDRKPQANVFFKTHVDWIPIDESLKALNP